MTTFLVSLFVCALIDCLNPTGTALQIYLLSTRKPIVRSVTFILGVFTAYWTGGLLFALGLTKVIADLFNSIDRFIYVIKFISGVVLIAIGWTLNTSSQRQKTIKRPKSLKPINTFLLGMVVTVWDLPTAIPYIAVIEQLIRLKLDLPRLMLALFLYNLIFVLPQIVLLGIYVLLKDKSVALFNNVHQQFIKWSPKVLRVLLVTFGFVLIVDCITALLNHSLL
ncbi:hypothetical protein SD81_035195 [Tolypothrix campylonemoides VB511288]|nr:hypothetical protein SD81_035195 [Tolypothrix campylonemoides VB511288]